MCCDSVVRTFSDALSELLEVLLNTRLGGIKNSSQSCEAQATAQRQLWASQLGLCWFDLEVLQLHGHAHVPRDLQLPLEERLNGRDGEREQIKKLPVKQQFTWSLQGLQRDCFVMVRTQESKC